MPLSPKKLLLSKWTARHPAHREKHFMVTRVLLPEIDGPVRHVDLQAVLSGRTEIIEWRELNDSSRWITGWK